jgi:hypothetical protein
MDIGREICCVGSLGGAIKRDDRHPRDAESGQFRNRKSNVPYKD